MPRRREPIRAAKSNNENQASSAVTSLDLGKWPTGWCLQRKLSSPRSRRRPDLTWGRSRTVSLSRRNRRWSGKCDSPYSLSSSSVQCYSRFWFCSVLVVQKLTSNPRNQTKNRLEGNMPLLWDTGWDGEPVQKQRGGMCCRRARQSWRQREVQWVRSARWVSKQIRTQWLSVVFSAIEEERYMSNIEGSSYRPSAGGFAKCC